MCNDFHCNLALWLESTRRNAVWITRTKHSAEHLQLGDYYSQKNKSLGSGTGARMLGLTGKVFLRTNALVDDRGILRCWNHVAAFDGGSARILSAFSNCPFALISCLSSASS